VTSALFINSGALSAPAGMLLASRIKTGSASSVIGTEFKGITAAILGGNRFGGGSGTMLGAFIGIMIINSFNNGLTVMGVDSFWQKVAQGALLIVALLIDFYRHKANKKI
jgi:ribose/xylose/arabinose/galactoside ABC-type transport system permease subunit